jgi:hypothetical protein
VCGLLHAISIGVGPFKTLKISSLFRRQYYSE